MTPDENRSSPTLLRHVAHGVRVGAISQVALRAAPALLTLALARIAGPAPLGVVAYGLSVLGLAACFADVGIPVSLPKCVHETDREMDVAVSAVVVRIFSSTIVAGALLLIGVGPQHSQWLGATLAAILVFTSFDLVPAALNATLRFREAASAQVIGSSVFVVGGVAAAALGLPVLGPLAARAIGSVTAGLPRLLQWLSSGARFRRQIGFRLVQYGAVAMIPSLMSVVYNQADLIIVSYSLGYDSAGVYKVAATIATVPAILSSIIATPLQPVIAAYAKESREAVVRFVTDSVNMLVVIAALTLAIGTAGAGPILHALAGTSYVAGSGVFGLLLAGNLVGLITTPVYSYLLMGGGMRTAVGVAVAQALLSLVLNLLLIPRIGLAGGGLGSVISYAVGFGYQLVAACRASGRWPDLRNAVAVVIYALIAYAAAAGAGRMVPERLTVIAVLTSTATAIAVFGVLALLRTPPGLRGLWAVMLMLRAPSGGR